MTVNWNNRNEFIDVVAKAMIYGDQIESAIELMPKYATSYRQGELGTFDKLGPAQKRHLMLAVNKRVQELKMLRN